MNTYNFISLDLEMNQPSEKIIQIGAVAGNLLTGEIFEELNCYIKIDENISPFITQLTGITDEMLQQQGVTLQEGYAKLTELHKKYSCQRNAIVWGGGDSLCLREQLGISKTEPYLFGYRWLDFKTVFQLYQISQGGKLQAGLSKAMGKMGIAFQGTKHRANDDAKNTFRLAALLIKKFRT